MQWKSPNTLNIICARDALDGHPPILSTKHTQATF